VKVAQALRSALHDSVVAPESEAPCGPGDTAIRKRRRSSVAGATLALDAARAWVVTRDELEELHYITPIENLPSIMEHGVLSHRHAAAMAHRSVAMTEIQKRRAAVVVPGGRPLHEYANLYISARNPMMFMRKGQHRTLCVLRIQPEVLDLPGVVVTDGNASSVHVSFRAAPDGLKVVDKEITFADDWRDPDKIQYWRKKTAKCAEVLVPDRVPPIFIVGAYVSCDEAKQNLNNLGLGIPTEINAKMFFR